jgi:septal ring factor EnvC (AmiA/AmiB activator)
MSGGLEMYKTMRVMINHAVPDIISQQEGIIKEQEKEITKLREELNQSEKRHKHTQDMRVQSENRHEHTRDVAVRMAYRIAISKHRGAPVNEKEEEELIDSYVRTVNGDRFAFEDDMVEDLENIFNREAEYLFDAAQDVIEDANATVE